jgi:hypothetical protein
MNCRGAENLIQTSLDRALNAGERRRLDRHIVICTKCEAAWKAYRELERDAALLAIPRVARSADDGYAELLMERIIHETEGSVIARPSRRPDWLGPMLAAAACIALLPAIVRLDPAAFSAQTLASDVSQLRISRITEGLNAFMPDSRYVSMRSGFRVSRWPTMIDLGSFKAHDD